MLGWAGFGSGSVGLVWVVGLGWLGLGKLGGHEPPQKSTIGATSVRMFQRCSDSMRAQLSLRAQQPEGGTKASDLYSQSASPCRV